MRERMQCLPRSAAEPLAQVMVAGRIDVDPIEANRLAVKTWNG